MADQSWKTSLKQCHKKLRGSCHIASLLPALRSLLTDEEYSRVEDMEGNFGRVDELVTILLDKDESTFNGFCTVLEKNEYLRLSRQLTGKVAGHSASILADGLLSSPEKELAKDQTVATPTDGHVIHSRNPSDATVAAQASILHVDPLEDPVIPAMSDRPDIVILSPKECTSWSAKLWSFFNDFLQKLTVDCPDFGILVVGETGVGKSTLINNLLGKEVVEVGHSYESETATIVKKRVRVEGVHVTLYDTPGLGDSRGHRDDQYLREMRDILKSGAIHLVIYCIKLSETRMRASLIRTFQEYHKIGAKLEHGVMALTFADYVPVPKQVKNEPGFEMGRYFNNRVAEMRDRITRVLVEQVGVKHEVASKIECYPSIDDLDVKLPNGEEWYVPLWLHIMDTLSPGAMAQYLKIHANSIVSSSPEEAVNDSPATPLIDNDASESAVQSKAILPSSNLPNRSKATGHGAPSSGVSVHDSPSIPPRAIQQEQLKNDSTQGEKEPVNDNPATSNDAPESAVQCEIVLPSPRPPNCSKATGHGAPSSGVSVHDSPSIPPRAIQQGQLKNDSTQGEMEPVNDNPATSNAAPESAVQCEIVSPSPNPLDRSKTAFEPSSGVRIRDSVGVALKQSESVSPTSRPLNPSMRTGISSIGVADHDPSGIPVVPTPLIDFEDNSPDSSSDETPATPASKPKIRLDPGQETRLRDIILKKVRIRAKAVEDTIKSSYGGVIGLIKSLFSRRKKK